MINLCFAAFTSKGFEHRGEAKGRELCFPDGGYAALCGAACNEQHKILPAQFPSTLGQDYAVHMGPACSDQGMPGQLAEADEYSLDPVQWVSHGSWED